jgi:hypothetical protein
MDVLVLLDECDDAAGRAVPGGVRRDAPPVAYVHWVPVDADGVAFGGYGHGEGAMVITLCGEADAEHLAVASRRRRGAARDGPESARRRAPPRRVGRGGRSGDVAWRVPHERATPVARRRHRGHTLERRRGAMLVECGAVIRQTAAKLAMRTGPKGCVAPSRSTSWRRRTSYHRRSRFAGVPAAARVRARGGRVTTTPTTAD